MDFSAGIAATESYFLSTMRTVDNFVHVNCEAFNIPVVWDFIWLINLLVIVPAVKHCHRLLLLTYYSVTTVWTIEQTNFFWCLNVHIIKFIRKVYMTVSATTLSAYVTLTNTYRCYHLWFVQLVYLLCNVTFLNNYDCGMFSHTLFTASSNILSFGSTRCSTMNLSSVVNLRISSIFASYSPFGIEVPYTVFSMRYAA